VLVAGDEGVLVANRLSGGLPVIDQVDTDTAAACRMLAVEVRPPGHTLRVLADPVALGARLGLDPLTDAEAGDAAAVSRTLADQGNAVVGLLPVAPDAPGTPAEPWVLTAEDGRLPLRAAIPRLAGWPVGAVYGYGTGAAASEVDDLFAVDLAAAAEAATARQGSTGRAVLVASLSSVGDEDAASVLGDLLQVPVHGPVSEPAAARLGALTTPGGRDDAVVVDLGAGTIDVIGPGSSVVAAGAGELLTAAGGGDARYPARLRRLGQARALRPGGRRAAVRGRGRPPRLPGRPRARVGGRHARGGGPGRLAAVRPAARPGRMAAIRLRLKQAVLAANFRRAVRTPRPGPGRRSSWSAVRPGTRNCSACWPARCRTAWPSAAVTSAAPAPAGRSGTATPSRSAWLWRHRKTRGPAGRLLAGLDGAVIAPGQRAQRGHQFRRFHDREIRALHPQVEGEHFRMVRAWLERDTCPRLSSHLHRNRQPVPHVFRGRVHDHPRPVLPCRLARSAGYLRGDLPVGRQGTGVKRGPAGARGSIRSARKVRQASRSVSQATRYQRRWSLTRRYGSTERRLAARNAPGSQTGAARGPGTRPRSRSALPDPPAGRADGTGSA
jgi:hypothetical protein